MIPFLDLRVRYSQIKPEIDAVLAGVLKGAQFVLEDEVAAFEEGYSR